MLPLKNQSLAQAKRRGSESASFDGLKHPGLAIGGDSAGGNISAAVAQENLRDFVRK